LRVVSAVRKQHTKQVSPVEGVTSEGHVKVASFGQKTWERRRLACIGAGRLPALPGDFRTLT
jgi:hypothetical protein